MSRIGIDATAIKKEGKGISRYQKNIIQALMRLETQHEFFVFHRPGVCEAFSPQRSNWHFVEVSISKKVIWDQFQLPKFVKRYQLDLMYVTSDRLPFMTSIPFVMHLFEIPTYRMNRQREVGFNPRWYHRLAEAYDSIVFPRSLQTAALLMTGSQFTKEDLAKKFHVPEEKIKVVYAACESNFKPAATADSVSIVRSRVSAGNPYLLHFSTGDSRDNTETVLAAFEQVRFEFPGLKLVIVGHPIDSNDVQIERSENDLVIRLPFVSDNELIELYQAAEAYVDPSLYEGFGFQPLEAMACGAPVVASDVTAVPEVVQDAGILVDPCNPRMLAEAISKLLHNPSLRDDLREKGLRRAASFNWNQTAQEVLAGFETVLKEAVCKVAVLTEIISPYRIPVFNEIAKDSRINLNVIFFAETSGDRKWKISKQDLQFKYLVSWGIGIPLNRRFPVFFNPMIFGKLLQINPDVIICGGYQHPSFLMAYFFAKLFRKQIILWSESHALSIRLKQWWAMFYRRAMVKQSSAYLVPGKLARNFLLDLGAHSDRIYAAPNAVDNDFFYSSSRSFCASKEQLKEERKWPRRLILYVGLLVDAKGIRTLLEAFSKLPGHEEIGLILVGDGPGEKHYRRYCKEKSLKSVFFEGFKQQDELPLYYGVSDFLVMPSFRDEWGLVINEAMAAGLPVIVSDRVGAAYDLVQHGVNGYQFPAGQEDELARYLDLLVKDDQLRKSMGERSLEMIKGFHPRQGAVGFIESSLHVFEQNLSKGRR